ncbi:hypothetical protein NFI96_002308 [Prochilodus magdalenae]|nr:hypothetical protein NFI96_002308 [Prochilodus magdalenae]
MAAAGVIEPSSSPWAAPADSYPLPRIDDALDKVAGSSWFSLWQFRSMAFGLRNAPATFERLMERVLAGIPKERCVVYLDDVLAHAPTFDDALTCLEQRKVQFLGHVISGDGVATDPDKGFADVAAPLHQLTAKGAVFEWSERDQFVVDTDASNWGVGAVLSQVQGGTERVIAYYSRALSKPERNYCVTRRELLAVVAGLRHFRHYLYGTPFLLRTDHAALTWLMNFKEPEGQVARWIAALQTYQFEIHHRAECRYCTRLEAREELAEEQVAVAEVVEDELIEACSREEFGAAQAADPELKQLFQWKREGRQPDWCEVTPFGTAMKAYRSSWANLEVRGGLLYRRWEDAAPGNGVWQLLVPHCLRDRVLRAVHGPLGVGHFGVNKTLRQLRQRFYWPSCRIDVELFVHCCDACTAKKGPGKRSQAPLQLLQSGAPMERVGVDVLGPFPVTDAGNRYVLVAVDYFTKWPEAYAVPDQSAATTAGRLVEEFFCRFGLPEELHSDQGRNFESHVLSEVCRRLGIRKTRTTPLHPQSDGLVERFNRTLATQLAILTDQHQRDWDRHLPLVLWSCRAAVQESTGFTPAQMMLAREMRTPTDLIFGRPPETEELVTEPEFVRGLRERVHCVHQLARQHQGGASARQKRAYDTRCQGEPLAPGAEVWLFNPRRKKGRCPKLQADWEGPCVIVNRLSEVVYRVRIGRRTVVVHRDRLAPYQPKRTVPSTPATLVEDMVTPGAPFIATVKKLEPHRYGRRVNEGSGGHIACERQSGGSIPPSQPQKRHLQRLACTGRPCTNNT